MSAPVTITCPMCRQHFPVPTQVVGVDPEHHTVLVTMDRSELYGHLQACAAEHGDQAGEREQAKAEHPAGKEVERWQPDSAAYVAKGTRPCTMCGTSSPACMAGLANSTPCCGACGEGNTHPSKHESLTCAQWAAEHLSREG